REHRSAKFPKCRVEVSNVQYVAGGVADHYSVADTIRRFDEDIYPTNKARERRLQRKAEHQRYQAERDYSGVPVRKKDRERDEEDRNAGDELCDAIQVVARGR